VSYSASFSASPGTGEDLKAPVYVDGQRVTTLSGATIVPEFIAMMNEYVGRKYKQELAPRS
jgi:(E)-4-hydroxy-3-methylbut-2-enyl-diphosphate synthase